MPIVVATSGGPNQSTCSPWATSDDLCSPCDDYALDTVLLEDCLQAASDILFELSGRRFSGVCQDNLRPYGLQSFAGGGRPIRQGPGWYWGGAWWPTVYGPPGLCGPPAVSLGVWPLNAVSEVLIDGAVVDTSTYRVDDRRWLVRVTPDADTPNEGWPSTQRMDLPTTEENTWQVTALYGTPPPPAGVRAAGRLGCELALACSPETVGECNLPQRVTSITRQGVSMDTAVVLDPMTFLEGGRTGLYECDVFLAAYGTKGLRRNATVMSPDIGSRVRRAGTVS